MANKWRSSLTEANAVFEKYGVSPTDLSTEVLIRKWTGISRAVLAAEITTLRAVATVTNPRADGQTYSGTWNVDSIQPVPVEGGNLAGSVTIYQTLKKNVYSLASPDNMTIMRSRAYPLEQNENAWMYYERYRSEVTRRWHNILAANIEAEYEKVNKIFPVNSALGGLTGFYSIGYVTSALSSPPQYALKTYWTWVLESVNGTWQIDYAAELTNPIIRECWYEQNTDGTFNLFRSLETTSSTSIMRTRALQYAGMTLVQGAPMLDDTALTISGFNNLTEVVYAHTRFRVGNDIYRVATDATAVGGQVTVSIYPTVSQATEDAADENPNQLQCFFEAV